MSSNGERKPNNNYNGCVKPIPTLEHGQMPFLSLSSAWLLEKNNLPRTMKYFDAAEKIHAGADANQNILNVHRLRNSLVKGSVFRSPHSFDCRQSYFTLSEFCSTIEQ